MRELYDPSADAIVQSRKEEDDDGNMDSVFLDHNNKQEDRSLMKYGPQICSYIYWAQQAGIPLKLENKKNSELIS